MTHHRRAGVQRPDPYLAVRGDVYRQQTEAICKVATSPSEELRLRGAYVEISLAIVEDGGPSADDDMIAARRTRMSPRLWRTAKADLQCAGLLTRTPDGLWMTPMADDEFARRDQRRRQPVDDDSRITHPPVARETSEIGCNVNDCNPPYPNPIPSSNSDTNLPFTAPRARVCLTSRAGGTPAKKTFPVGLGHGGVVSTDARRKVARRLRIGDADPLVAMYEDWPASRTARDADGLFIKVAPKLYREATAEVRRACRPLDDLTHTPAEIDEALRDEIAKRQPRPSAIGDDWKNAERNAGSRRRRS